MEPAADGVGFASELNGVDTAANGDAGTELTGAGDEVGVPFALTVTTDASGGLRISGGGGASAAGSVGVDTADTASVVPEAKVFAVAASGNGFDTAEVVDGASTEVGVPDALRIRLAGAFEHALAREGEAAFRGDGDDAEHVQVAGDVGDGEGADNTSGSVGVVVSD